MFSDNTKASCPHLQPLPKNLMGGICLASSGVCTQNKFHYKCQVHR